MSRFNPATKEKKLITPYFVECFADFSWAGSNIPENLAPYTGGNYYMTITGNQGESFVTVTGGGNITDAGTSRKWSAVIKDGSGNWTPYYVTGTDGVNKVNIYPPLKTTITNGEIANIHDVTNGQHYTERGYFALAQHIYNAAPQYAERNKFLKKFKGTDGSVGSPWTKIGNPWLNYNYAFNIAGLYGHKAYVRNTLNVNLYANGTTQGLEWQMNLNGKTGFLETFIGSKQNVTTIIVEFYLDGVLQQTITGLGNEVKRLVFPFRQASTGKIRVYIPTNNVVTDILISDTTWWVNEKEHFSKLIPARSKVVYLGDSWGVFHTNAITRELDRLIGNDSLTTITSINKAVGGMTTNWGKDWFTEYVLKEKPTHVIIEFFVNDYNSGNGSTYGNYTAPDGSSKPLTVTKDQWRKNVRDMIQMAISNGIQPIIVCPCATASGSQTQELASYNTYLVEGVAI